jgi:hypothetical protein
MNNEELAAEWKKACAEPKDWLEWCEYQVLGILSAADHGTPEAVVKALKDAGYVIVPKNLERLEWFEETAEVPGEAWNKL